MAEIIEEQMQTMEDDERELKAVYGPEEHLAIPMYEDAPCYPEKDLVELYWIGEEIVKEKDREKRLALIQQFAQKRDSIQRLPDAPERVYLWPEGKIPCLTTEYTDNSDYRYNHNPDFVPYFYEMLVPEEVTPKGIVLFCAGGDHGSAVLHEAYQSCKDFNAMGYQAILLANRTNENPWKRIDAAADCSRAIRMVRMNAAKYRVDADKVAFAGFSNGGLTGENVIQYFSGEKKMTDYYPDYQPDEADSYYGTQDAFLCIYGPRWVGKPFDFTGVKYPPTFFAVGRDDLAYDNFNYVYPALIEHNIPVEVHTFAGVPHGAAGLELLEGGAIRFPNFQMWIKLADYFLQDLWK